MLKIALKVAKQRRMPLLRFTVIHIPIGFRQILISSFSVTERTNKHTHGRTKRETVDCFAGSLVRKVLFTLYAVNDADHKSS